MWVIFYHTLYYLSTLFSNFFKLFFAAFRLPPLPRFVDTRVFIILSFHILSIPFLKFFIPLESRMFSFLFIGFYLSPMLSPAGLLWVTRVSIILSFRLLSSPFFNFFNLASQPVPLPFYPAGFSSKPLCFVSWLTRIRIIQIFPRLSTLFDKFF